MENISFENITVVNISVENISVGNILGATWMSSGIAIPHPGRPVAGQAEGGKNVQTNIIAGHL